MVVSVRNARFYFLEKLMLNYLCENIPRLKTRAQKSGNEQSGGGKQNQQSSKGKGGGGGGQKKKGKR